MSKVDDIIDSIDHHEMVLRENFITKTLDKIVISISEIFNWIWVALLFVIIGNVILRYAFSQGMIELEELQWHLYAIGWLVGLSSTFILDGHVRVDVVHDKLKYKTKIILELLGLLFLLLPFVNFVLYNSLSFVELSWITNERSTSANGLPARWAVKGFLLFSFILLDIAACSRLIRIALSLKYGSPNQENNANEGEKK
ncbi:MAG: TRAP transporter small permease subunit [Methylocystaceae bacterium]|nr:TRAP transporter small permease subunit [Methylocystaceae bacterium]